MPASSPAQERLMEAAAHTKGGYGGVPQSVGKEFTRSDADVTRAAGIMFLTKAGEVLLLKRGPGGDCPGMWCFPGGTTDIDETAEQTATRETIEELGFLPDGERIPWTRRIANTEVAGALAPDAGLAPTDSMVVPGDQVDFTTFLQRVPERFDPKLNGEHTGFAWALPTEPPEPLHPGARIALDRLTMNELGVARAIATGDLTSPQKYENVWLFAIRITGTGKAFRNSINEHVWRDPSLYLNDEFLARCNGLPVIWVHPEKKPLLTSDEFADRVIGTIFFPYIQGQDVWGVAKIYDQPAIEAMQEKQFSTSPGVNFADPTANTKIETEDGKRLLIEGEPSLLDHIAVVTLGVWDKSGPPTGVLNHSLTERVDSMAEETEAEKKAKEDAARRDAGGNVDRILAHLDSMSKRMDAFEAADKARKDAEEDRGRKDAKSRRDAERAEWMKADAATCERDDAEEEKERGEMVAKGEPEETAADRARKDRRDRMDARRKDAESEESKKAKEDAARKDAEEKARDAADRKDAQARVDAVLANQTDLAIKIAEMPKSTSDADYGAMADTQATYDQVYQMLGKRAPVPLQGEAHVGYRRRLARGLQPASAQWKGVDLHTLPDAALGIAEQTIRADAAVAARNSDDVPDGALLPVTRVNESGHRITEFRGRLTIFSRMAQPAMRATKWHTERRA